jgi:glutamate synthase domain-containing protein 2/glutamate synthase domain-containing protein 3
VGVVKATENYVKALCDGLLKIMSKMGISTLRSYRGAQVFEAVGLGRRVVDAYFEATPSRIGGIGCDELAAEASARHATARGPAAAASALLPSGGMYSFRRDGERRMWNPEAVTLLQRAARGGDRGLYRRFAALSDGSAGPAATLRGLLALRPGRSAPLDEVEPVEQIARRFVTGAMSFGSISREAHETLAVAMNRMGAMSNSGEGGEDPARRAPLPNGDSRCSAVKQVASGRFGVTAEYLASARELQIKIAQGAKPGEGGQLPGHKVNAEIAGVRHSTPGVTLISPPPHHDIYSIEDIKELIYDLRCANPDARISVKLVSEAGVGTIAAGVAKGGADMILISGADGGTGASPLSSIKHAGLPWELGLAETQQTLVLNGLRDRVRLQTDGQMRTGRDVVIAALLGAEEFGFATAPLVVCGCVMERKCHQNTCSVGVATQDPELRKRFAGKPEHVIGYFTMIAEEVREHMALLGFRRMDEMIGRSDMLEMNRAAGCRKAAGVDLSALLHAPESAPEARRWAPGRGRGLEESLDLAIIEQVERAVESGGKVDLAMPIANVNRAVGTVLSGRIARRRRGEGLPEDTVTLRFRGAAGQSFGAFCCGGMTLILEGEANDYLGKGLCGAKLAVRPYPGTAYDPARNVIAGNVLLYGATGGEAYINGCVGERFAVRNSGALSVVEGVGDHGCEYMTGGRVVVLGPTGVNFAAGMSGGIAYVLDEAGTFDGRCNLAMVDLETVTLEEDQRELRRLVERHVAHTGSRRGREILDRWDRCLPLFVKVFPTEYRRALGQMTHEDEATEREQVVHA